MNNTTRMQRKHVTLFYSLSSEYWLFISLKESSVDSKYTFSCDYGHLQDVFSVKTF